MHQVTKKTIERLKDFEKWAVVAVNYRCGNCGEMTTHLFPIEAAVPNEATCNHCQCPASKVQ